MKLAVGQRWMTRSGAAVEIVRRVDTGLTKYRKDDWVAIGKAWMIICRIVRFANGEDADPNDHREICVHDDGRYLSHADHELDLIREFVSEEEARRANRISAVPIRETNSMPAPLSRLMGGRA